MPLNEITLSRIIEAPPARVWQVLTDLDHAAETLSGVLRVEVLTDGPYALGTRWRETRKMFGREASEELWVADNDPLRRTQVRASSGGVDYVTEFVLTPVTEPGAAAHPTQAGHTEPPTQAGHTEPPSQTGHTELPSQAGHTEPPSQAGHTELTIRFGAEMSAPTTVQKVAMKAFTGLAARATTKALEQDLADIAAAAEN